ncbi:MAG: hypothetical protein WC707_06040 [Candidatus Babeliaceae bacterium]|jgi:hypothetical protein
MKKILLIGAVVHGLHCGSFNEILTLRREADLTLELQVNFFNAQRYLTVIEHYGDIMKGIVKNVSALKKSKSNTTFLQDVYKKLTFKYSIITFIKDCADAHYSCTFDKGAQADDSDRLVLGDDGAPELIATINAALNNIPDHLKKAQFNTLDKLDTDKRKTLIDSYLNYYIDFLVIQSPYFFTDVNKKDEYQKIYDKMTDNFKNVFKNSPLLLDVHNKLADFDQTLQELNNDITILVHVLA